MLRELSWISASTLNPTQGSRLRVVAGVAPEAIFDLPAEALAKEGVVVDDEIQLLRREAVVLGQHGVDFVEDGFGLTWIELVSS